MDRDTLRGSYARLRGIRNMLHSVATTASAVARPIGQDFDAIIGKLSQGDVAFSDFRLNRMAYDTYRENYVGKQELISKVEQVITYLEYTYQIGDRIIELGSIYNSIHDEELKARCSDLLSAPDNFDRVINQATQVLETRLRAITGDAAGLTGADLVNKYVKADPARSPIILSSEKGEQEGYANLLRGVMGAFRNPSHHKFLESLEREQALQICAFIDNLLRALGEAEQHLDRV